jgi:hypothetical protein
VNTDALNSFSPAQQIKVTVMQNNRWDNAQTGIAPTFVRGNVLEYNSENNFVFPGGKEWRWLDLRGFRLQSDRVQRADYKKDATDIYVKTDGPRSGQRYVYYQDLNGWYEVVTYENINPYFQGDYATVHFSFAPPGMLPYPNKNLYLFGQLTDYKLDESSLMKYTANTGLYENSVFLKQGYYSYGYLLADKNDPSITTELDGNYYETENIYTIFVYYKSFSDQVDELIGIANISTRGDRPGTSF